MTAVLDTIKAENETELNRVIGTSPVELDGVWEHIRIGQTNLGNVITDAYLLATGADIAFENAGGIRASIAAGTVTYGDVINVSPYGNYVVTKKLNRCTDKGNVGEQSYYSEKLYCCKRQW